MEKVPFLAILTLTANEVFSSLSSSSSPMFFPQRFYGFCFDGAVELSIYRASNKDLTRKLHSSRIISFPSTTSSYDAEYLATDAEHLLQDSVSNYEPHHKSNFINRQIPGSLRRDINENVKGR